MVVRGLYFLRQLRDDFPVDKRVHIGPQHEQDPPIAQINLPTKHPADLYRYTPVFGVEDPRSDLGAGDDDYSVDNQDGQHGG